MHLYGNSTGNGAGWPIFLADTAGKVQTLLVNSKNSSLEIVLSLFLGFSLLNVSLEKTRMYSWMSHKVGFLADSQLPHAVEGLALASLFQIISPLIRKPIFNIYK